MDELLTVSAVAEKLGVHIETVRRWIRDGDLPAIRFARKTGYRIRASDLAIFLEDRETESEMGKAAA